MQISKYKNNNKGGFTFIETMVAITVLLLSIVLPMTMANDGITAARLAQDQIVAFYLAQEGVEVIRSIRDHNRLDSDPQLTDLNDCVITTFPAGAGDGCVVDATVIDGGTGFFEIADCSGGSCPAIRYNEIYSQRSDASFVDTKFTREVRVWYPNVLDESEAKVEVVVSWEGRTAPQEHVVRAHLFDW